MLELVAVGGKAGGIGFTLVSEWRQLDLDNRVSPVPSSFAVAGADDESMEPAIEAVWIADRADMDPGGDQRLLDSVGGKVVATKDEAGRPMQTVERLGGQRREGVVVATTGAKDEISLHLAPRMMVTSRHPRSTKSLALRRFVPFLE